MKLLVLFCSLLPLAVPLPLDLEWNEWKIEHGKQYKDDTEENYRYGIWKQNLDMINSHNELADQGKETYWLGMNQLGDMTQEEIVTTLNGYIMPQHDSNSTVDVFKPSLDFVPEKTVDWRTKGAVTPIKNQKNCGSCWAFSATGSLEGQHFLKKGKLVSLSEQNLIDCSGKEGNSGCYGGLMDNAFRYVVKNKGIDTEKSYPYLGKNLKCHFKTESIGATEKSFKDIQKGSVDGVIEACSKVGPISVAMDASSSKFHFYKKGIYKDKACSSKSLDHGVLVVGYGTESGDDYFLVKNSWGKKWGMEGYFMISRKKNMCGIATKASYPIV